MLTINHEAASNGFEDIQDGVYEVVISPTICENATKGGTEFIDCRLIIRNDVQQPHQNGVIFHKIWKSKETNQYVMGMIQQLAKFAQLPNGKQYQTLDPFFDDLRGKPLKVEVKNESSEYNGKTYENLNVKKMDFTAFPSVQHQYKESNNGGNGMQNGMNNAQPQMQPNMQNNMQQQNHVFPPTQVTNDDLPF